jgi:hypothetical protein
LEIDMAKGALFVSWGELIPGREETGSKILQDAMTYLGRMQAEGRIEGAEAVILEPVGGTTLGFVLVKGERDTLAALRVSPEFLRIVVGIQLVHRNVAVVWGHTGAEMGQLLGLWAEREAELLGEHA